MWVIRSYTITIWFQKANRSDLYYQMFGGEAVTTDIAVSENCLAKFQVLHQQQTQGISEKGWQGYFCGGNEHLGNRHIIEIVFVKGPSCYTTLLSLPSPSSY